jgi:hypothetical protein
MNKPLVSVVLVARNVDPFLAEAIESILGQTCKDFEFIIGDYGSTDKSKDIASSYAAKDSRIRLHEIPPCGLAEARNAACSLAHGRYIAVMDADDVSLPNRLLWETEFLESNPEVALLGGAVDWIDATGRSSGVRGNPTEDQEIKLALLTHCPFWHPTVMIRREAFARVGGYRKAFVLAQDYDLELRVAEHFKCANLKEVVLNYRVHPYQVTLRKQSEQTLCKLAAQASAKLRKEGAPDLLDTVQRITPELLLQLGVSEAAQQRALASDCSNWLRAMCAANEDSVALEVATGMIEARWAHVERWRIADLHLVRARLLWRKGRLMRGGLAVAQAVITRPLVVGRPLRPLMRRLGFVR